MGRYAWIAVLLLLMTTRVSGQTGNDEAADAVYRVSTVLNDIAYSDKARQTLDVYLPGEGETPLPTLLMIHGGGFVFGDKASMRTLAGHFVDEGYAVVAPNYRLAPRDVYPAAIEDVFCALAWTYAHADDYGFDATRIALMGESAGATAAAMLGAVDDVEMYLQGCAWPAPPAESVQAVIAYYPGFDLSTCDCEFAKEMAAEYLGVEYIDDAAYMASVTERFAQATPLYWVDGDEPPFLLIHGLDDDVVPASESQHFRETLHDVGGQAKLLLVPGEGHAFIMRPSALEDKSLAAVDSFLDGVLGNESG
jgi:acetyl esterase/lipase